MATTKTVSYSELETYRQCPLKHQVLYLERWGTDDVAAALGRGSKWHSTMEAHYRELWRQQKEARSHKRWLEGIILDAGQQARSLVATAGHAALEKACANDFDGEEYGLLSWMYEGYLERHGLDQEWEILGVEESLEAWLPTHTGSRSSFKLVGTIDLVVRDYSAGGGIWIVDHKTCRNLPKDKDLDMEDQTALYTYLKRTGGIDIRGAIYNHARTWQLKRPMGMEERFSRSLTVRTPRELRTMVAEAYDAFRDAYRNRRGVDARRHPDGERCGWKCNLTEPCLAARKSGPGSLPGHLEGFGFKVRETKPGPTFEKLAAAKG